MKTTSLAVMTLAISSVLFLSSYTPPGDSITDARDGKVYKIVKIGSQVWMAENLWFDAVGSKCYQTHADNCERWGRLYDWEAAKKSCPEGWHLPSREEWDKLIANYSDNEAAYKSLIAGGPSGFNATLHGLYALDVNQFVTLNEHGAYWSSTEFNGERAWAQRFLLNTSDTYPSQAVKLNGQACRCVKN